MILVLASAASSASPRPVVDAPASELQRAALGCACDAESRDALIGLRDRIKTAPSLKEARALATRPVRLAGTALGHARFMAPRSMSLVAAGARLDRYKSSVASAATPAAIAAEFESLMKIDGNSIGAESGCDYTGVEIIAIVLGFILGIIPGIILLLLLC